MNTPVIFPPSLRRGDRIAVISPATTVKSEFVEGGVKVLEEAGFRPAVARHALGPALGSYAASDSDRLDDLLSALSDPGIRAIYCARGGYGCVHLLKHIPADLLRNDPKWLLGFSDISALHALWQTCGVASVHAPMMKHLSLFGLNDPCSKMIMEIISASDGISSSSRDFSISSESHPLNRLGVAEGILRGGNLAVLDGLAATPFDMLDVKDRENVILFIEDIAEPIYKVERMLTRLYLAGALSKVKGLVVGQFTEYKADSNFTTMEDMIAARLSQWGFDKLPVAFNFPIGHVDRNMPVVLGAPAILNVGRNGASLQYRIE